MLTFKIFFCILTEKEEENEKICLDPAKTECSETKVFAIINYFFINKFIVLEIRK